MTHEIKFSHSEQAINTDPKSFILDALIKAGVDWPYGCRKGLCGKCKAHVLSGDVDVGSANLATLDHEERQAGMALLCCAQARSPVLLDANPVQVSAIKPETFIARLDSIDKAADDVAVVKLRLVGDRRMRFIAGQYIDVLYKNEAPRSFSLANAPEQDEVLELHIRYIAGGQFTSYLFTDAKPGGLWKFVGPMGQFYRRKQRQRPMIFIAGGTGFAPIKSLVESALSSAQGLNSHASLYWGARNQSGLYQNDLATSWASAGQLRYTPVLSEAVDGWQGRTGLVHEAVMADFTSLKDYDVYVCGAPEMVQAAYQDFRQHKGLPDDAFFADSFDFAHSNSD